VERRRRRRLIAALVVALAAALGYSAWRGWLPGTADYPGVQAPQIR